MWLDNHRQLLCIFLCWQVYFLLTASQGLPRPTDVIPNRRLGDMSGCDVFQLTKCNCYRDWAQLHGTSQFSYVPRYWQCPVPTDCVALCYFVIIIAFVLQKLWFLLLLLLCKKKNPIKLQCHYPAEAATQCCLLVYKPI